MIRNREFNEDISPSINMGEILFFILYYGFALGDFSTNKQDCFFYLDTKEITAP
jgi:hypothetical protein